MLQLQRVVKRYRTAAEEVSALEEISMSVTAGETVALQGPSGSGKTTLLLLAARALLPDAGSVSYRGRDLARMSEREASQYRLADVGLISQNPRLMPNVSAVENAATRLLLAGLAPAQAREHAMWWLTRVGLEARAARAPEELSLGERRRVALARALATAPTLILADEPTANLDSQRSAEIVALLRELSREGGRAVLLVTHDNEAAAVADRVLHLRDGRLQTERAGIA